MRLERGETQLASTTPTSPSSPFDELFRNRIIFLGKEVDDEIANELVAKMTVLDGQSHDPIWLYINSPGGSITAGMAIYDQMKACASPVYTACKGEAASMGQFLLSSGEPGKRFVFPHARILMHQPSGGVGGKETDVRITAELIKSMKTQMAEMTAEQTGHTVEEIYRDNEYDHWYTAAEALEYGFVDHVVSTDSEMAEIAAGREHGSTSASTAGDSAKPRSGRPRKRETAVDHKKEA